MNCEELKSLVTRWFSEEVECQAYSTDSLSLTLPLLKPDGDQIELGLDALGKHTWRISDLGNTISTFFLSGLEISEDSTRGDEFRQVVSDFKIKNNGHELYVESDSERLIESLFDFVHAVQSVLALQLTAKPQPLARDFSAIVAKFLSEQGAVYDIPNDRIPGKTGRWKFSFILNHVRPTTLVKTLSVPTNTVALKSAQETVFEFLDIRAVRNDAKVIVIADDEGPRAKFWQSRALSVFEGWNVPIYPFVQRREELTVLAKEHANQ